MVRAALVAAALVALNARSSDACSCPVERGTLPSHGDVGVATNLKAVYFWGHGTDAYLVASDLTEMRGQVEQSASMRILLLTGDLMPETSYTLQFTGDTSISPAVTFTTGSAPDRLAPPSPRFADFHIDWLGRDDRDTCGPNDYRIRGYLAVPPGTDTVTMGMRFTDVAGNARDTHLWPVSAIEQATGDQVWFPGQLGTTYCANRFTLEKGATYLVEAWSIDRAGNTSEPASQTVTLSAEDGGCSTGGGPALPCFVVVVPMFVQRRRRVPDL